MMYDDSTEDEDEEGIRSPVTIANNRRKRAEVSPRAIFDFGDR